LDRAKRAIGDPLRILQAIFPEEIPQQQVKPLLSIVVHVRRERALVGGFIRGCGAVLVPDPDLQMGPPIPPLYVEVDQREDERQYGDDHRANLGHALHTAHAATGSSALRGDLCSHYGGVADLLRYGGAVAISAVHAEERPVRYWRGATAP
jgi:hypothetical protein